MASIAARPHGRIHVRIQAVGLGPREYAALAARSSQAYRPREALGRAVVVTLAAAGIAAALMAIGGPWWLGAIIGVAAAVPVFRAMRGAIHDAVIVERHAKAA